MFILLLDPISGPEGTKNQPGKPKIKDPESLLKPLLANLTEKPNQAGNIRPGCMDPERERIKHILIRVMLRAAGQLFTRDLDPSPEMIVKYLEQYTGQEANKERQRALQEFFNAIKEQKPDVKSHPEEFFNALIDTWNKGCFEGLPELSPVRPDPVIDQDIEELKKKGIEVLDGGVDPIAGTKITLKIHDKEYSASYSSIGGVYVDSLKSEDGASVSPDIITLVKENNELITRVRMKLGYHYQ